MRSQRQRSAPQYKLALEEGKVNIAKYFKYLGETIEQGGD